MRELICALVAASLVAGLSLSGTPCLDAPQSPAPSHATDDPPPAPIEGACGTCSETIAITFAVGDDFFSGEYETEEEADAALTVEKSIAVRALYFESLTAAWQCPECWDAIPCQKYWNVIDARFEAGVAFNPANGMWTIYVECSKAGTMAPCCTACPVD